ncbi:MAG: omptin family outer membrane protease [bacterium]|nr:omptin family outer membrane protease [bacterium]
MKNRILCLSLILTLVVGASTAFPRTEFSLAPTGGYHWGHTLYKFEAVGVQGFPSGTGIGSELIFPLDFPVIGAAAEVRIMKESRPAWTIAAHFAKGVSNPGDVFTDRDWYAIPNGLIWNFSWTESEVDASFTEFGVEAERLIAEGGFWKLSFLVGVDYQKISQDALGFKGAQYDVDDVSAAYDFFIFSDPRLALTYEITYFKPHIGLAPTLLFGDRVSLQMQAAASPLVRIKDKDNHLLRFFETESDGRGFGFFSSASLQVDLGSKMSEHRAFLALDGSFERLSANLSATSTWYGNDPIDDTPGDVVDNTGWEISGIPHDIRSSQYSLALRFGYSL